MELFGHLRIDVQKINASKVSGEAILSMEGQTGVGISANLN